MQAFCDGEYLWEPSASSGTLEISLYENGVGLHSPYGWDLRKMQLKTESKDNSYFGGI